MNIQFFSEISGLRMTVIAGCLAGMPMVVQAGPLGPDNQSLIGPGVLSNMQGAAAINLVAGDDNQQANLRALSLAPDGSASAVVRIDQNNSPAVRHAFEGTGSTRIEGDAFRNASGVIGVNQVAGAGNRQVNVFTFGAGQQGEALSDSSLSGSSATTGVLERSERSAGVERVVAVDDSAFLGARGVVQLNQTVGAGNSSANTLGIRMPSGSPN